MKKLRSTEGKGFTQSHMAYWAGIPTQACPGSWAPSFGPDSPVIEANPIHGGLLRPWKITKKKKIRVTYLGPSLPFFLLFSPPWVQCQAEAPHHSCLCPVLCPPDRTSLALFLASLSKMWPWGEQSRWTRSGARGLKISQLLPRKMSSFLRRKWSPTHSRLNAHFPATYMPKSICPFRK